MTKCNFELMTYWHVPEKKYFCECDLLIFCGNKIQAIPVVTAAASMEEEDRPSPKWYIDGYGLFLLCLTGLIINFFAIFTLFKQKMSTLFHKLMLSLVVYDLLYVLFIMFMFSLHNINDYYRGRWKNTHELSRRLHNPDIFSPGKRSRPKINLGPCSQLMCYVVVYLIS